MLCFWGSPLDTQRARARAGARACIFPLYTQVLWNLNAGGEKTGQAGSGPVWGFTGGPRPHLGLEEVESGPVGGGGEQVGDVTRVRRGLPRLRPRGGGIRCEVWTSISLPETNGPDSIALRV